MIESTNNEVARRLRANRIVVGVDGSDGSRHALRWALEQAELRGAELEVVEAWEIPYVWAQGWNTAWADDQEVLAKRTEEEAGALLDSVLDGRPRPEGTRITAAQGEPAYMLLQKAEGASMLVLGTRGRGGFSRMLLGSVSTTCVQHAPCPVVVVPDPDRDTE